MDNAFWVHDDIDALCQLAYELLNKLTYSVELFQEIDKPSDP